MTAMSTTAKIGAFTLVVLALVAALVLRIQDLPFGKGKRGASVEVRFANVAGLDDKSAVRIAGVRVGRVDGIRLLPDGTAVARLLLDRDVELREGSYGQIRNMGLLGDKYVELFPGRADGARVGDGARLPGSVPTGFDDLTKLAGDIGKDVKELTGAFSQSMGGDQGAEKLNRIVDNVGRLAESLARLVDANRQNVDISMANLQAFSAEIRETLARVDRILDENRSGVRGTVTNLDDVTGKLKTTADNLNSITKKIDTGDGTVGKLLNSEETHKNLNEALQSVKTGVDSLNTTLTRINRIELDLGFRGEWATRPGQGKAYVSVDVSPRQNKFYRFEVVSVAGGVRKDEKETTTVLLPDGTTATTVKTTERFEDTFAFSALLGLRQKNTVFRAGIIENRGGAGIDHFLLKDRLVLTGDAWDFARPDRYFRMKVWGQYRATPSLFVSAGVDELFNSPYRSLFVGAGIRWRDEDVKSILGVIPFR